MKKKLYMKANAEVILFDNNDVVMTAPNDGCGGRNSAGYGSGEDGDYGVAGSGATAWGSWGC